MGVWSDKVDHVDTYAAAHVNQLATAMGTAYDYGGTTTLYQLAASHAAAGAHTNKIGDGDIVDNTVTRGNFVSKCLATRQATEPTASGKGWTLIDTVRNNTYCDSEGSWQPIIIGTANIDSAVAGSGLEMSGGAIRVGTALAGNGLTGGGGSALAVGAGGGITVGADAVSVKYDDVTISEDGGGTLIVKNAGIGVAQISTAIAGTGLTGGGGAALSLDIGPKAVTLEMLDNSALSGRGATAARPSASTTIPTGYTYFNTQTESLDRFDAASTAWTVAAPLGQCLYADHTFSTAVNPELTMPQYQVNAAGDPMANPGIAVAYRRRTGGQNLLFSFRAWKTVAGDTAGVAYGDGSETVLGTIEVTGTAPGAAYAQTIASTALTAGSIYLLQVAPFLSGTPSGKCYVDYISIWEL